MLGILLGRAGRDQRGFENFFILVLHPELGIRESTDGVMPDRQILAGGLARLDHQKRLGVGPC